MKTKAKEGQMTPLCLQTLRNSSVPWEKAEGNVKNRPLLILAGGKREGSSGKAFIPSYKAKVTLAVSGRHA